MSEITGSTLSEKRAYEVILEMLEQRGYSIVEKESEQIIASKPEGDMVVVFFIFSIKFNIKCLKETQTIASELGIKHIIVVIKDVITPATKKSINHTIGSKFEFFTESDLQYNITKHVLQPKFERISEEEAVEFKKKYGVKFPVLKQSDPVSEFYGYEKGDVIKITRKNGLVVFRIVK